MGEYGDGQGEQQGQGMTPGDELVGRIMSAEANLAMQQGNPVQAGMIWGQMFGNWLQRRMSQ